VENINVFLRATTRLIKQLPSLRHVDPNPKLHKCNLRWYRRRTGIGQRIAKSIHELQISKGEIVSKNLDLNTATEQELAGIQGIGRDNAKKIVDHRNQNGRAFKSWEDLKGIPGMPGSMLDTLKRQGYTIGGKAA